MAAQGGLPASAAATAPSLTGSAPDVGPMDAHDLAAPELNVEPQAQDPDRITVDEVEGSDGAMQPRQFLGAAEDDDGGGEPEPVADVDVTPTVANDGPPALSAAAVGCTPKAWHEKDQPAFKDKDNLTDEFLSFFAQFPKPKDTGLCKMITTRQCMDQQKKTTTEKQRRTFLNIVYRTKLALCRLYTDHMDSVDIKDHHWVMNRECCCCYPAAACSLLLTAGHCYC